MPMIRDLVTLGVDVGGTKVLAGVVDATGRVLSKQRRLTPSTSAKAVEDTIVDLVADFSASYRIAAVGIGAAGFVDASRSTVLFSPHLAWQEEPLRANVGSRVGVPVVVDNDANMSALAECRFGAGVGHRIVLCVTLGTGIGGAVVIDGRVFRGANGMAGEFGHIQMVPGGHRCECGNRGCWEQYASGNALVRESREMVSSSAPMAQTLRDMVGNDPARLSGPLVTEAANRGDPLSMEMIAEIGRWLGTGLAGMTAAFDPSCILVGGGVSEAGELLLAPTREAFRQTLTGRGLRPEPPILAAALGADAGFVGAAEAARSAARRSRRGRRRNADRRTRLRLRAGPPTV